ncbi:MAG: hypothetical protein AAGG44_18800 [Planctomycetota bacterium]
MVKTWSPNEKNFRFQQADASIEYLPKQPEHGASLCVSGQTPWSVFRVKPIPQHSFAAEEIYVRQEDLLSQFDQTEQDNFAFHLNHRLLDSQPDLSTIADLELWLSVQTDDLDSEPVLVVSCESPDGSYWETIKESQLLPNAIESDAPAAIVCPGSENTGVWLIDRGDQRHSQLLSSPSEPEQRVELFSHFMEKGVIRRARMRFHLAAGQLDKQGIAHLYQQFLNSPLPLTA